MNLSQGWNFLQRTLGHPVLAASLARAGSEHRRVEEEFQRRLLAVSPKNAAFDFPNMDLPLPRYFEKNFFSILFLSIFEAVGIPPDRRLAYGVLLHAVRGIVTSSDNILDGGNKGSVRLDMNGGGVMPNVFLILLQSCLLQETMSTLIVDPKNRAFAQAQLMDALYSIAAEESGEEKAIEEALAPDRLMREIHSFRGARLLGLAFVVPEANEPTLTQGLERVRLGIHRIGLALQALDDLTDFTEDLRRRNHNLLRSWILHRHPDGPSTTDADLLALAQRQNAPSPEEAFPQATGEVVALAMALAKEGLSHLESAGYLVTPHSAQALVETLIRLRSLANLLGLYKDTLSEDNPRSVAEWLPGL